MDSKVKIALAIAGALVVLGVLGFFLFAGGGEENGDDSDKGDASQQTGGGSYIDWDKTGWNQAAFEAESDQQRWIYFYADWCPDCVALDAAIEADSANIPEGVLIYKISFDANQDLRQRYGVPSQTTIVAVDSEGEKIGEILATGNSGNLVSIIKTLYVEPTAEDEDEEKEQGEDGEDGEDESSQEQADSDAESAIDSVRATIHEELREQTSSTASAGSYIDWNQTGFDQAAFEAESDQQRWIYFHADWCPDCVALNTDIEANLEDIPEGVLIYKISYDDNQDLRQRYGIPRQSTIIAIDSEGEKTAEILAIGSKRNLKSVIGALE